MDNVSEIYSLYSGPMTRGSSAACSESEYLPTPLAGPRAPQTKPAFVGPRSMPYNNTDLVRVHSSLTHDSQYEDGGQNAFPMLPEFRSPQDCGPEPYEEYFSIPISKNTPGLNDARRRPTRELIKRFESMGADNSPKAWPMQGVQRTPVRIHRADAGLFTPPIQVEKKTSPLRQSFRNLLSVFKKGKRFGKEKVEPYIYPKETAPSFPDDKKSKTPSRAEYDSDPFVLNNSGLGSRICTSPTAYSLHMGPLLHLSLPTSSSSPILPVWIPCDAVLHRSHILLTSATAQGIRRTDVVSLRACTDITSLASGDIDIEQRALLPTMENSADPKVFELLFDGKENQRFAAPTVKDRAAWVSAIWDVILGSLDKQMLGRTKAEIMGSLWIDTAVASSIPAISSSPVPDLPSKQVSTPETDSVVLRGHEPSPQSQSASSSATVSTVSSPTRNHVLPEEKSLAEIAPSQRSLVDARKDDPESALSNSLQPPSGSTRSSHSPSIVNLGRRSVVRKRLAEMRHDSTSGSSTPCASRRPPHTVSRIIAHEGPASNAESEAVPELAGSESQVNVVEMLAASVQSTSPESSQVSSLVGLDSDCLTSPVSAASGHATLSSRPKSVFRLRDEMHARNSTSSKHRQASERSSSPSSSHLGSQGDGTVDALLDVMDVHAERQLIKTAELSDQLEVVQNDVRNVAANMRVSLLGREEDSRHLAEIHTAVDDVRIALTHLDTKQHYNGSTAINIDERIQSNQAEVFQVLEEIQAMLKSSALSSTADRGSKPGPMTREHLNAPLPDSHDSGREHTDLTDIKQKLDLLVELSLPTKRDSIPSRSPQGPQLDAFDASQHVKNGEKVANPEVGQAYKLTMHDLKGSMGDVRMQNNNNVLLHDEDTHAQLMEQQAESVRYLNELNMWLETFVNGGTAQIMSISEDVQKLCKTLGNIDELQGDPEGDAGASQTPAFTLLQGIRRLAEDNKRRDRDSAHILGTVNGLVAALNEDMRKNAEMRNTYSTESVLGVIERQRQDQERMLRALANELSDDIRGERLRFVEAMKEATAINVQIHVEEFKKELTREVLISTQEVGRLQRERQLLEQQIADLFAFYSKQKQTVSGDAQLQPKPLQPRQEQNRPPSRDRALPFPPPGQRQRS